MSSDVEISINILEGVYDAFSTFVGSWDPNSNHHHYRAAVLGLTIDLASGY